MYYAGWFRRQVKLLRVAHKVLQDRHIVYSFFSVEDTIISVSSTGKGWSLRALYLQYFKPPMNLPAISAENYSRFITGRFEENRRKISPEAVSFVLDWTRRHTYYTQSGEFLSRYSLGAPAGTKRAIDALLTKEMIYEESDSIGAYYSVYDLFLSRWLERQ